MTSSVNMKKQMHPMALVVANSERFPSITDVFKALEWYVEPCDSTEVAKEILLNGVGRLPDMLFVDADSSSTKVTDFLLWVIKNECPGISDIPIIYCGEDIHDRTDLSSIDVVVERQLSQDYLNIALHLAKNAESDRQATVAISTY